MDSRLRCGLIGLEGSRVPLDTLAVLESQGVVQLVCASDPEIRYNPKLQWNLQSQQVRIYEDFQDLFEKENELDAVVVAPGIPFHACNTATALARGLFVYLDKPPVPLIQQLNDLMVLDRRQ